MEKSYSKFFHLDQDAYVDFQPMVLKATQMTSPQVCVNAITGIMQHSMGVTRNCPKS